MQFIKQKSIFDQLRKSENKLFGKYFLLIYLENEENTELAVGITVSKKVGNAVVRNLIKRRLHSVLRDYHEPPALSRFQINIIARPDIVEVDFLLLKKDLYRQFERLNQYANN
ncbi:MAG TPA: ribonuclease P protein component [Candidatus Cloacimonadota bacterium]|jgi:ribonuclease P protein component|nr:ribonuclease P protein component [Candidatus Cloacimonadales bacterium]HPY96217.1 ribonuclease P protein component [Candidatus Cloacimonadota bacterium]HQB40789.1 ribonuclease P protein component [Candidatus Cloacimonadota bacterium]